MIISIRKNMKRNMIYSKAFLSIILIISLSSRALISQELPVEDTISLDVDLFSIDEPAEITLAYNLKEYAKNSRNDEYVDATLVYHLGDSMAIEKEVRLKSRGNNRKENCQFPPLWINIKKAKLQNRYLEGVNKIKLVTHCANSQINMDYVLKEYLVYKIYNIISPYSFRVRLVRITYIDTGRNNREFSAWGFLIEPEEILASRLNSFPLEMDHLGYSLTDRHETDVMSIFQYIVGNPDFSITGRHNIKLLKINDINKPRAIPIPYDFDYTGFVNANYAVPGDGLPITRVTQRYYLGPCRSEETFNALINDVLAKKDEIYEMIESFEYLDRRPKEIALDFLDDFFLRAGNKDYLRRYIISTCRDTIAN
jgi:hypothetical protein